MASEGYKRQLSSRRGRVMCRWNWFQFATKDATINGNLRNATAETEAHPGLFTSGFSAFPTAPGLAPKWRVDALPNWLRRPTTTTKTVNETSREEWAEWRGGEGCACKRPNFIKSCINHEPRPCFCCCALSSHSCPAAWPRPIWQQSFVSSAASCFPCSYSLHLRLFVLRLHWDIFALLRRMNFYLPATVAESRVHVFMNFSALCRRQCGRELTF